MISCCRENHEDLDQTSIESEVFDIDLDGGGISDGEDVVECDDVNERESIDNAPTTSASSLPYTAPQEVMPDDVVKSKKCLAFSSKIMELLTSLHGKVCHRNNCTGPLQYKESFVGTCFVVSWTCGCGHLGGRWASQPTCEDVRAGNLLLASAIALSGNSFTKVGFLFKICNIAFFSKSLFNQYQHLYIAPTINEHWEKSKTDAWNERAGKSLLLSSDGRNDSPGHCAQYCTYSFADMDSKEILNIKIVDVREVENRKSTNMERVDFERGLDEMLQSEMVVKEIVTDGHVEIGALMSKYYIQNIYKCY